LSDGNILFLTRKYKV